MDKCLQKVAVASVITLFSTTVLSSFNAYQDNSLLFGLTIYAQDPPADEDVPDANEWSLINNSRALYAEALEIVQDPAYTEADKPYALQPLDEINLVGLKAINKTQSRELVAQIEALYAQINRMSSMPQPAPIVTEEKENVPVATAYIADPEVKANTQTVLNEGTPGEITYTVTNGVRDQGTETIPMIPKRVSVGTKTEVVTEAIPAPAAVEELDANLEEGKRELKTPAVLGSKTTTTTYTLDNRNRHCQC
ncbi:hypothetical protein D3X11_06290 [Streptococcus sp. X16XC17]|uniref:G5 domain-containing protein n=1 Tax=unclassified Streptococcus TaxID=2608887 RepID=UPI00066FFA39|nr:MULTISPECIES: G5 domain-containing protein [unclassified Streptococcus]TCD45817.1 hypothetical protein D3X11_06290 [Streptococcus sp. X16XC17]